MCVTNVVNRIVAVSPGEPGFQFFFHFSCPFVATALISDFEVVMKHTRNLKAKKKKETFNETHFKTKYPIQCLFSVFTVAAATVAVVAVIYGYLQMWMPNKSRKTSFVGKRRRSRK